MTTELVVTQHVPAPVAAVWEAWSTAQGWARWWWPQWPDTVYELDARPGGAWLVRSAQGGAGVQGEVRSLDPPHSLQLTWRWDGEAAEDLVDIELTQQDDGTSVTVRHRTAATGAGNYRQGWEFVLANLAASLRA
jgi:uncharacterized protein YndB with AHSA1/START domain